MSVKCAVCDATLLPAEAAAFRGVCEVCWSCHEEELGLRAHDRRAITGRKFNVPLGVTINEVTRVPGTGDGSDYFGNHT